MNGFASPRFLCRSRTRADERRRSPSAMQGMFGDIGIFLPAAAKPEMAFDFILFVPSRRGYGYSCVHRRF
jgi:hypothetical protein